jgi:hypothetical protein
VKFFPSLVGVEDETQSALFVIVAHKWLISAYTSLSPEKGVKHVSNLSG